MTTIPKKNNFPAVRSMLMSDTVKKMVSERLGAKSGAFITSVLDLVGNDKSLAQCDPMLVMREAMKAAALDLPISKQLGFAYVVPYKGIPSFQMGYKGYIQLAVRTGAYRHINTGIVYEGERMIVDRIRGTLSIEGEQTGKKTIGYFSYMELISGFTKAIGWTTEQVKAHARKYSASFRRGGDTTWMSQFDEMAQKTMLLQLIPKYGPMSIEIAEALGNDFKGDNIIDIQHEIKQNANQGPMVEIPTEIPEEEQAEIIAREIVESQMGQSDGAVGKVEVVDCGTAPF